MSHELRTPMNGVLGMIDVLEAEGPGKDQKHTLMMMRESAQVLLRNINDLLDYSRIEAGGLRLEELPFLLKDLIDGAVEVFQPQAARKGLSLLGVVTPGSADAFMGDPTRVRQIIFNLLSNALKFTDRGGIMLRAGAEPANGDFARVTLSVRDTGIGISAEQQSRLFRPFTQVDNSITRRFGGSGLGLSIVKQLAELMSGDVTVHSLPGSGATFTVTLKLKPAFVADGPAAFPTCSSPLPSRSPRCRPASVAARSSSTTIRSTAKSCCASSGPGSRAGPGPTDFCRLPPGAPATPVTFADVHGTDGRLHHDRRDSLDRDQRTPRADADHRRDGRCAGRRRGTLPRGGHGRLSCQAGRPRQPAQGAAALASRQECQGAGHRPDRARPVGRE
jgi:hypothetical protein